MMTLPVTPQTFTAHSDADTQGVGATLSRALVKGAVIYLQGDLGAGKTTFVRGLLRGLGYSGKVKSPTYTIVEPYETDKLTVFHFDLYRLIDAQELQQIGLEEYFNGSAVCLIEWPDKGAPLLPAPDLILEFDIMKDIRNIRLAACTSRGEEILARL